MISLKLFKHKKIPKNYFRDFYNNIKWIYFFFKATNLKYETIAKVNIVAIPM